jgi:hypothetical protein
MSKLPTDVRLAYEPKTTAGPLYDEYQRCGRRTKTYRKSTRHRRELCHERPAGRPPEG